MTTTFSQRALALLSLLSGASSRARRQREAARSAFFSPSWAGLLQNRSEHYRRLPTAHRERFERQTQIFLSEKRITGVEIAVSDETKLLVAASAVSLSAGWPEYTWDQLTEVLLYPQSFDRDFNFGGKDAAGMAHPWGIAIISVPALNRSFDVRSDAYHVGFHEFAHLLDLEQARFDGIPSYLRDDAIRRWMTIVETEQDRLRLGDSVISPYGLTAPVEFFATAVEAFFQTPVALADRHAELYQFLSSYFCQDPASWSQPA
jgi:Mlc titration factor MtfA (ptsG expression regulator)